MAACTRAELNSFPSIQSIRTLSTPSVYCQAKTSQRRFVRSDCSLKARRRHQSCPPRRPIDAKSHHSRRAPTPSAASRRRSRAARRSRRTSTSATRRPRPSTSARPSSRPSVWPTSSLQEGVQPGLATMLHQKHLAERQKARANRAPNSPTPIPPSKLRLERVLSI